MILFIFLVLFPNSLTIPSRIVVLLDIHRHSMLVIPVILELVQHPKLLRAVSAFVDLRFAVVSQAVVFQALKLLEAFSAECAGKSEGEKDWNSSATQ
jgi:hypothetical protein